MNRLVVLGAGKSGIGASLLAKKNGWDVLVSDNSNITQKDILDDHNIEWEESHSVDKILLADEVVKSPGIPEDISIINTIRNNHIPIISEIEFASRYTKAKIIAVTGTNGKTTTTLLIGHILSKAGYDVLIAGNIGISFSKSICERDYDYIVLELSSFQLDGIIKFKPDIAIILNITADHLDRYNNNFQEYISSKLRITKNQKQEDFLIYNFDDDNLKLRINSKARMIPFSLNQYFQEDGASYNNQKININLNKITMTINELALQGKHNVYNSMAAGIASRVLEVNDFIIRQSLLDFQNVEHRLEHVLNIHGIEFINDSKATNINSVWYALESMTKEIIWIVGGVDKGNNYSELLDLVESKVKAIVCIGQDNKKIHKVFKSHVNDIINASSMNEAVSYSYDLASKGDVVLLSPACASFDMFDNYEHRGIEFKKFVRSL